MPLADSNSMTAFLSLLTSGKLLHTLTSWCGLLEVRGAVGSSSELQLRDFRKLPQNCVILWGILKPHAAFSQKSIPSAFMPGLRLRHMKHPLQDFCIQAWASVWGVSSVLAFAFQQEGLSTQCLSNIKVAASQFLIMGHQRPPQWEKRKLRGKWKDAFVCLLDCLFLLEVVQWQVVARDRQHIVYEQQIFPDLRGWGISFSHVLLTPHCPNSTIHQTVMDTPLFMRKARSSSPFSIKQS